MQQRHAAGVDALDVHQQRRPRQVEHPPLDVARLERRPDERLRSGGLVVDADDDDPALTVRKADRRVGDQPLHLPLTAAFLFEVEHVRLEAGRLAPSQDGRDSRVDGRIDRHLVCQ